MVYFGAFYVQNSISKYDDYQSIIKKITLPYIFLQDAERTAEFFANSAVVGAPLIAVNGSLIPIDAIKQKW